MLIKYFQAEKSNKPVDGVKSAKSTGTVAMKMESGGVVRTQRKVLRICPAKRPPTAPLSRAPIRHRQAVRLPPDGHDDAAMDPCDNSNDSGLGLDHSSGELSISPVSSSSVSLDNLIDDSRDSEDTQPQRKRSRLTVKAEQDDTDTASNDKFRFSVPLREMKNGETPAVVPKLPLTGAVRASTSDGQVTLSIVNQPEQQHRARYQTEGSRGAVKDRSGQSFPTVKLTGYNKPATLQVFIGSDVERVTPHMFYQACRVCGKNSTPCSEQKTDGTIVIELQFEPAKNMIVTCDCVGILKERNVDVEHRFPEESVSRSKKKSTRCRMVFRTSIERPDGSLETLQVVSQPIACTQLPGVPEISKRSLDASPSSGGLELFLLGKNFLKDSKVVFQQPLPSASKSSFVWEEEVLPDKEFLQPTHLVCMVPPFHRQDLSEPVTVRLFVRSSGKCSEPQSFQYLPNQKEPIAVGTNKLIQHLQQQQQQKQISVAGLPQTNVAEPPTTTTITGDRSALPVILPALLAGQGQQEKVLPSIVNITPAVSSEPLKTKSTQIELKQISPDQQQLLLDFLRQCLVESTSANVKPSTNTVEADPPMLSKLLRQYVSENTGSPLPAQSGSSVEKFLSRIESGASMPFSKPKGNNEGYISSTSLEYPPTKQHLPTLSGATESLPIQTSSVVGANTTNIQIKQGVVSKSIKASVVRNVVGNPVVSAELPLPIKDKDAHFQVNTTLPMTEVSTNISNSCGLKNVTPALIEQVILTTSACHQNSVTQESLLNQSIQEPVINILNTSSLMMQDVTNVSSSFDSQVNNVQINSQVIGSPVSCISETIVQPMVVTSDLMEAKPNLLATSNNGVDILNSNSLIDTSNQFQQTNTTVSNCQSLISIPVVDMHNEISQPTTMMPSINQQELVSDAHIMNTQLGQLLTTDVVPENPDSSNVLTGDNVNSPLVRDVLLGSGVTPAPLLTSTNVHQLHPQPRKATGTDGMLPQELTRMSDKDLLSYINPGCFDQVIP